MKSAFLQDFFAHISFFFPPPFLGLVDKATRENITTDFVVKKKKVLRLVPCFLGFSDFTEGLPHLIYFPGKVIFCKL